MRPYILSIAGFDPTGGAGILADAKAAEANGAYCLCVNSAITYQNDSEFDGVDWVTADQIIGQIEVLIRKFDVCIVKIGLIENLNVLQYIVNYLHRSIDNVLIIWDPILKASAGFEFHTCVQQLQFNSLLDKISLITPNIPEAQLLFESSSAKKIQEYISLFPSLNVLLKGGHASGDKATDILISMDSQQIVESERVALADKHGTGCVLSSTIAAYWAQGKELKEACELAKEYMNRFLISNESLLGYHYGI